MSFTIASNASSTVHKIKKHNNSVINIKEIKKYAEPLANWIRAGIYLPSEEDKGSELQ